MSKTELSWHAVLLLGSILVNIFLITNLYVDISVGGGGRWWKQVRLSWSLRGAEEAEAVASVSCSGHGRAYLDGLLVDGQQVCECNKCFQGPDCSEFISDCAADADGGNPLFLEPYWMQRAESSAVMAAGWHRMGYSFPDGTFISKELEKAIRKIHDEITRNANTVGKYILFGGGSTQLLNAAVFALSINNTPSSPAKVVATSPYYPLYKEQTEFFKNGRYEFAGDAALFKNSSDLMTHFVEFVTSPNNPDGELNRPALQGSSVNTIYDHAYYWPHFTAIPTPADEDIMIFTLSKLTGHARSRFGWAIVRDAKVYESMTNYLWLAEMGISRDTQLRALQLLRTVLEGDGRHIFDFAYQKMRTRWEKLTRIVSKSTRFSLQDISPQYCTFFQKIRGPSPAYAWLKCEKEEDISCYEVLKEAKIIGREGSRFNAGNRFVRLSLLKGDDDFDLLLYRLKELVSSEEDEDGVQNLSKLNYYDQINLFIIIISITISTKIFKLAFGKE